MIYRESRRVPCEDQPDYLRLVTIDRPGQFPNQTYLRESYKRYYKNSDEHYEEIRWYEKNEDCDNWDCLDDTQSGDLETIFQAGFKKIW